MKKNEIRKKMRQMKPKTQYIKTWQLQQNHFLEENLEL